MNKLEVGMYVRTNTGIHKIFEIDEKKTVWKYKCDKKSTGEWDGSYEYILLKEEQFIGEPSFDIVDVVQVGDYVNGYKVYELGTAYGGKIVMIKNETLKPYLYQEEIKSIVTKEQFESMKYEVE